VWSLIRKTSLQDRTDDSLRSSTEPTKHVRGDSLAGIDTNVPGARIGRLAANTILGTIFSSRCQISRAAAVPASLWLSRVHNANGHEFHFFGRAFKTPTGGARRDRTDDLLLAKQALSQLSYGPSSRAARSQSF
jgi:hypothetical protein